MSRVLIEFYANAYISHCELRLSGATGPHDDLERQFDVVFDLAFSCPLLAIAVCNEVLKNGYPSASSDKICTQTLVHAISFISTDAERELALRVFRTSTELRWAAERLWENGLTEEGHAFLRRVRQLP